MPDPGDTGAGDYGQGTSSSGGLGSNTGGTTYGGGGGRDSGAGGSGGMGGNYGGSNNSGGGAGGGTGGGSDSGNTGWGGGNNSFGGQNVAGGSNYGGSNNSGNTNYGGSNSSGNTSGTGGKNNVSGGVSGIASSGSSFNGPGVNSLNAPATSSQAYSNYNTPAASTSGGIASLGNQNQNTAFGNFQGPGVNNLNAPVNSTRGVPNNLGPRATSPQYTNAPTTNLGSYVKPFNDRVPTTYNDLGVAGVPNGVDQRFQYNQPTGTGIPANSSTANRGPFQGGYGNFDPQSQAYAVDRGLLGSQDLAENYTPSVATSSYNPLSSVSAPAQQPTVSTVGANSPFADPTVQAYNPLQSYQNYVVPAAQALAGSAPTVGPGNMRVTGGMGTVAFDSLGAAPPGYGNAVGVNQPAFNNTVVAKNNQGVIAGPGNMSVVGGQGTVAFDSLGAAPPGYGNAVAINQPSSTAYQASQTVAGAPAGVTSYGPMVDQYSFNSPQQLAGAMEQQGLPGPTPYAATAITSQQALANRIPQQTVVADNTATTPPAYDSTNSATMPDLETLPDPTDPTKQYVPAIVPGQEDYQPGTGPTDWAGRGNGNIEVATNQPTQQTPPPEPDPEEEDPDKDGLGWMKYYPNKYSSQSQTVALPELTYMKDPISTGVGSLLPKIKVTPYRTI